MRTLTLILFAALLLTGCRHSGQKAPHTVPGFSDHEIVGIDVSAHNGDIDFERVKAEGIEFVIIKASEGSTFKDKRFVDNVRKARKA